MLVSYSSTPIRVLVADDHFAIRRGLHDFLSLRQIQVTAAVKNGKEALEMIESYRPDIILTDVKMPLMDGIELCKAVQQQHPTIKVIAYTMFENAETLADMRKAGANGYVLKTSHEEEIIKAVHAVHAGGEYYCSEVKQRLDTFFGTRQLSEALEEKKSNLSETEKKIIGLICQEKSSKDIAGELNLSRRTIEHYQEKIRTKLGVHSVVGIAVQAVANWLFY